MATKTYTCSHCGVVIEYLADADLYDVVATHIGHCAGAPAVAKPKRITEVVSEEVLKGNLVTMDEILEQEILVTAVAWRDSTYKEDETYLSLTVELGGEKRTLNTGAVRVIQVFRALDPKELPIYAMFGKISLPNGHKVYIVK